MDRDQFTDKLESFIHQFVMSCGDIDTQSGGYSKKSQLVPDHIDFLEYTGIAYIDISLHGLPADKRHMATDVLQELIDKNPGLSEGVFLDPYQSDGVDQGILLHMRSDDFEGFLGNVSGEFPEKLFSAMDNEMRNPTIEPRIADNSCRVAEFNNTSDGKEPTVLADNHVLTVKAELGTLT